MEDERVKWIRLATHRAMDLTGKSFKEMYPIIVDAYLAGFEAASDIALTSLQEAQK